MSAFNITGKVAIVTGGASGIGYNFVIQLLEKGIKGVTLVDISETNGAKALQELRKKYGEDKVQFVKADTSNYDEFENAFKKTLDFFKKIDILINNAGVFDDANYQREVNINLIGVLHGMILGLENYIPKHKSGTEGVILNVSSVAGVNPFAEFPIYCATKFAIHGLTLSWGLPLHYKRTNVRVVGLCPGFTATSLVLGLKVDKGFISPIYMEGLKEDEEILPMQKPEELAVHTMDVIEKAPSGTMWVVEGGEAPYKYEIHDRLKLHNKTYI